MALLVLDAFVQYTHTFTSFSIACYRRALPFTSVSHFVRILLRGLCKLHKLMIQSNICAFSKICKSEPSHSFREQALFRRTRWYVQRHELNYLIFLGEIIKVN